mmetsp:Transcript_11067/g.14469  ORF Transcript_11067/g.14469 Transcript_11067/m.14469 type:complete len:418 (-) Transcript_11067:171-1424(-)
MSTKLNDVETIDSNDDDDGSTVLITHENNSTSTPSAKSDGGHQTHAIRRRTDSAPAAMTTDGKVIRKKKKGSRGKTTRSEDDTNALIKYGSLVLLVAQMVGLVLLMRYSRTVESADGEMYLASTAVFVMEAMKFVICNAVILYQADGSVVALGEQLYFHVFQTPFEVVKLFVPSLLYTVQNNLLYLALTNLDAATYQVCYQLKILTTALFSAVMLNRKFSAKKWFALVMLTVGVALAQKSGSGDSHTNRHGAEAEEQNRFVGLVAVLCAACTSGFSGVYFEKILKGSSVTLWIRNIQMGLPSVLIALTGIYVKDSATIAAKGMMVGFTPLVWTVIFIQAAGGLIVAVVVKYADSVLKVFAASFSIVASCIVSVFLFDFRPNLSFCFGTVLVCLSIVLYSRPDKIRRKRRILPVNRSG